MTMSGMIGDAVLQLTPSAGELELDGHDPHVRN